MNSSHIDLETLVHFTNQFEKSPKAIDSKLIRQIAIANAHMVWVKLQKLFEFLVLNFNESTKRNMDRYNTNRPELFPNK